MCRASARNRSRKPGESTRSSRRILIATRRPSTLSVAAQTSPIPPTARRLVSKYRSPSTLVVGSPFGECGIRATGGMSMEVPRFGPGDTSSITRSPRSGRHSSLTARRFRGGRDELLNRSAGIPGGAGDHWFAAISLVVLAVDTSRSLGILRTAFQFSLVLRCHGEWGAKNRTCATRGGARPWSQVSGGQGGGDDGCDAW